MFSLFCFGPDGTLTGQSKRVDCKRCKGVLLAPHFNLWSCTPTCASAALFKSMHISSFFFFFVLKSTHIRHKCVSYKLDVYEYIHLLLCWQGYSALPRLTSFTYSSSCDFIVKFRSVASFESRLYMRGVGVAKWRNTCTLNVPFLTWKVDRSCSVKGHNAFEKVEIKTAGILASKQFTRLLPSLYFALSKLTLWNQICNAL